MIKAQSAPAEVPISYGLRAMGADLAVVRGWFTEPHVTRWWPNPEVALSLITQHLSEPAMECFIPTMGGQDAGYLQVYDPLHLPPPAADEHASGHPYRDQPRGTRGIDLFIGEGRFIGRGHGSRLIRRILGHLFEGGIPCVVTDPDPTNARGVAAFRRAGFRCVGERDTAWGHVLFMRCDTLKPAISP
ncbi:MAG TPA: GNAT family N-acetyltransferase [Hyphomicrobiaceae bacterium]|nr:GNAT family N-acetyltransferase [Hyphomicrobiaceae bacterium]